ncbi:MAG: PASTA domain-containing protein [Alloprevotella sp.]|nr:MAG: PASTA domain-containing protein [Alloprevotella sp.]
MSTKTPPNVIKLAFQRYCVVLALFVFASLIILVKTAYIMFVQHDYWMAVSTKFESRFKPLAATRGNILSADGQVLATSLPEYRIYLDPMSWEPDSARRVKDQIVRDSILTTKMDSMLTGMKRIIPDLDIEKTRAAILKGRAQQKHNISLYPKRVTYIQLTELKKVPLLNLPIGKSGFTTEEFRRRKNPYGRLAIRTIGNLRSENDEALNGLELAFDSVLSGKPGVCHRQKVANRYINLVDTPAVDGCDVVTTIDVGMQDLTEKVLGNQLRAIGARAGMCILMEVQTGNVKAMSSLSRLENGNYAEIDPRAVTNMMEPGSVFKPMSFMVAMDDGKINMNTTCNTGNGIREMHGRKMRDSDWRKGGNGVLTVPEIIKKSSNVGVSTLIDNAYASNPDQFVSGLQRIGIMEDLHIPIPGYKKPRIRYRRDNPDRWYGTTLPWMSIGYETQIPPISTLTFYNGVANGGKLVAPRFVTEVRRGNEVVQEYPTVVLRERMCKPEVLRNIQICLEGVVGKNTGTGKLAYSKNFAIAGKTGTAQIWSKEGFASNYLVSFAGYFPADRPRYSMIVCIEKGAPAYGGIHCCPVFKKVAEGVMAKNRKTDYKAAIDTTALRTVPPMMQNGNLVTLSQVLNELQVPHRNNYRTSEGLAWGAPAHQGTIMLNNETSSKGLPSVIGYGLRDAVYRLERMGVKVKVTGMGRVVAQSLPAGTPIKPKMVVKIALSMEHKIPEDWKESEEIPASTETENSSSEQPSPRNKEENPQKGSTTPVLVPSEKKTEKKTEKKDSSAEKKKETSANNKGASSNSKEHSSEKKEDASKKKDTSSDKKGEMKSKSATQSDESKKKEKSKKDNKSSKKEEKSSKKQDSAPKKDTPSKDKRESASVKKETSPKKKEDGSKKKDSASKSKETATRKKDDSSKKSNKK